jgi:Tfp pilus assembly protein PilF
MLQKAVLAFETVIERSPSTIIAYLFCARTYRLLENDEKMAEYYRKFIEVSLTKLRNDLNQANPVAISEATPNLNVPKLEEFNTPLYKESLGKISKNLIEAYNNLGAHFANIDKTKAVDSFNQTLLLDPTNDYATKSLAMLK